MVHEQDPTGFDFDGLSKLDKPNIDFVVFKRLDDATFWRSQAYTSGAARANFIGTVEALVQVCRYYWQRDPHFIDQMNEMVGEANDYLAKNFSPDSLQSSDGTRTRADVAFELACKKFDLVMQSITKSTKALPHVDEA